MIWVGAHVWWAWQGNVNTSNFQGQKSLTYEFSTLDETVNEEEEGVKSLQFKTKKSEPCNFRSNQY